MREREGTSGRRWPCQCQDERVDMLSHIVESFAPSLSAASACASASVANLRSRRGNPTGCQQSAFLKSESDRAL